MKVYSYVIEHDYGFAPNPFHRACTLAACKPEIRRTAAIGDIIVGTGAAATGLARNMVYWMKVDEISDFTAYWDDPRFVAKRPDMKAPGKLARFGDNIYRRDAVSGMLVQAFSFHSKADGSCNAKNFDRDTRKTERVLIGRDFAYFGMSAPEIPPDFRTMIKKGPGHKCRFDPEQAIAFRDWAMSHPGRGYLGKPTHWRFLK